MGKRQRPLSDDELSICPDCGSPLPISSIGPPELRQCEAIACSHLFLSRDHFLIRRLTDSDRSWVADNRGLAASVARKFEALGLIRFDEAREAAYYGLCRAILTYDPSRNIARTTHAWYTCYWYVKVRIRELAGLGSHGPLPSVFAINFTDLNRSDDSYGGCSTRYFDPKDPSFPDGSNSDSLDSDAEHEAIEVAIASLPERLADIVRLRMVGKSLYATGWKLGISKERVRQLENKAHAIMRKSLEPVGAEA